jgi:hypothetical protein
MEREKFRELIEKTNFDGGQTLEDGQAIVDVIERQLDYQRTRIEKEEANNDLVAQNDQSVISRRLFVSRAASAGIVLAAGLAFDQASHHQSGSNETHLSPARSTALQKVTPPPPVARSTHIAEIVHEPVQKDTTQYKEGQQVKDVDISVNNQGWLVIPKSLIDQTVSGKYQDALIIFTPKVAAEEPTFRISQEGTTEDPYATLSLGGVIGTVVKDPKHNGDYQLPLLPTRLDKTGKAVYTIQQEVQRQSPDRTVISTQIYTDLEYSPYILTDKESGLEIISQVNPDDDLQVLPMLQEIQAYTRPFLKAKRRSRPFKPHVFFTPQRTITSVLYPSINPPCPEFGFAYSPEDFAPEEHDLWQEDSTFVHGINMTADSISDTPSIETNVAAMQNLDAVTKHLSRRFDELASTNDSEDSLAEKTRFTDIFDPNNKDFSELRYIDSLADVNPLQIKFAQWLRTMKHHGESFLQDENEHHIALTKGPAKKECQLLFTACNYVLEAIMPKLEDREALIHGYSEIVACGKLHPDEFKQTIKDIIKELRTPPKRNNLQMSVKTR